MSKLTKKIYILTLVLSYTFSLGSEREPVQDVNAKVNESGFPVVKQQIKLDNNIELKNQMIKTLNQSNPKIMKNKQMQNPVKTEYDFNSHLVDHYSIKLKYKNHENICNIAFSIYKGGDISKNLEYLDHAIRCVIDYNNYILEEIKPSEIGEQTQEDLNAIVEEHTFPNILQSSQLEGQILIDFGSTYNLEAGETSGKMTRLIYDNGHIVDFYSIKRSYGKYDDEFCWISFYIYSGGVFKQNVQYIKEVANCLKKQNIYLQKREKELQNDENNATEMIATETFFLI